MTSLSENGFISSEVRVWIKKFRSEYSEVFNLADETNRFCQKSVFQLDAHSKHLHEILVATLYIRTLSNYQAVILLAERGMMPEARTITRAMLETVFSLCAVAKSEQLATDYVREDQKKRLKFLNKFKEFHGDLPKDVDVDEIEELENRLKEDIKQKKIKERTTKQWAEEAGLSNWYLTAYALLSDSVHTKVRDLERYLVVNGNHEIKEFKWGPDDTGMDEILLTAIEAILIALKSTLDFFKKQKDEMIDELHDRLKQIVAEHDTEK